MSVRQKMKTRFLIIGIAMLVGGSALSTLGLIAGQELNNQGDTDIFPDQWNATYNPAIGYAFAWIMIVFIPVAIIGIAVIVYGILSRLAKQISLSVAVLLLGIYAGIIIIGYPYT